MSLLSFKVSEFSFIQLQFVHIRNIIYSQLFTIVISWVMLKLIASLKDYVATRWYRAPELCGSFFSKVSVLYKQLSVHKYMPFSQATIMSELNNLFMGQLGKHESINHLD